MGEEERKERKGTRRRGDKHLITNLKETRENNKKKDIQKIKKEM